MYRNLDLVQEAVKRYGRCKDGVERIYIQESHGQAVASFLRIRDTKHAFEFEEVNSWRGLCVENLFVLMIMTRCQNNICNEIYFSLEVHRSTDEILRNACEQFARLSP